MDTENETCLVVHLHLLPWIDSYALLGAVLLAEDTTPVAAENIEDLVADMF